MEQGNRTDRLSPLHGPRLGPEVAGYARSHAVDALDGLGCLACRGVGLCCGHAGRRGCLVRYGHPMPTWAVFGILVIVGVSAGLLAFMGARRALRRR